MSDDIKTMQLYPRPERILADLDALGYSDNSPIPIEVLSQLDQLHYHGTDALDIAIDTCKINAAGRVLEIGSGWGGCARYIADRTGAALTAVELQHDYDRVARILTERTGLQTKLDHVNFDFLKLEIEPGTYTHAVSWLALFHIPQRDLYLSKIHDALQAGGWLFAEDLYLNKAPESDEHEDFIRHLFPNSLVDQNAYYASLTQAGFEMVEAHDMTQDWTEFTHDRLTAFRDNRDKYEAVHGQEGYTIIETFYTKMAGYFARGLVGGLRYAVRRT